MYTTESKEFDGQIFIRSKTICDYCNLEIESKCITLVHMGNYREERKHFHQECAVDRSVGELIGSR